MTEHSTDNSMWRRVRSFVRREGRMTTAQTRALEEVWPFFGCSLQEGIFDAEFVFKRKAPLIVEIGFGMGQSLAQMANAEPQHDFIGIEVHRPGVGSLLQAIKQYDLRNLRVYNDDAVEVLQHAIPDHSLSGVQIYFPDPWHKKRHHKRRLIQSEFVKLLYQKLKPHGFIHLATDWEEYAEHMLHTLNEESGFKNTAENNRFIPKPERRLNTKFEKRGERLGHGTWDLLFIKKA